MRHQMIYYHKRWTYCVLGGTVMAHEMTIRLTDQEYAELTSEAAKSGKQPETLLREFMRQGLQRPAQVKRSMTGREFAEKLYREGVIENLATREPLTP